MPGNILLVDPAYLVLFLIVPAEKEPFHVFLIFQEVLAYVFSYFRIIGIVSAPPDILEDVVHDNGCLFVVYKELVDLVDGLYRLCDVVHVERPGCPERGRGHGVQDDLYGSEIEERPHKVRIAALDDLDIAHELQGLDIGLDPYLVDEVYFARDDEYIVHFQVYHSEPVVRYEHDLCDDGNGSKIAGRSGITSGNGRKIVYLEQCYDDAEKITERDPVEESGKYDAPEFKRRLSFVDIHDIVIVAVYLAEMGEVCEPGIYGE